METKRKWAIIALVAAGSAGLLGEGSTPAPGSGINFENPQPSPVPDISIQRPAPEVTVVPGDSAPQLVKTIISGFLEINTLLIAFAILSLGLVIFYKRRVKSYFM